MTCSEARGQLLVADLADLDSTSTGALATHMAHCESCRAAAMRIVGETALLRRRVQQRRASTRRNRVMLWAVVPAAAVVVAIVMQARALSQRSNTERGAQPHVMSGVGVDVSRGQHATVIKTADPKVTIVWLTPGVGE
jgi:hypothetical protein